jgi:hypothetical protein
MISEFPDKGDPVRLEVVAGALRVKEEELTTVSRVVSTKGGA